MMLRLFHFLQKHKIACWSVCAALFAALILIASQLHFKEDIADFLPLTTQQQQATQVYQELSGAERIVVIFEAQDRHIAVEDMMDAVDTFALAFSKISPQYSDLLQTQIDMQPYLDAIHFVYQNIPLFLTAEDYERIDSLLSKPDYIGQCLNQQKARLQMPISSFVRQNIIDDPLQLFSPVAAKLQQYQPSISAFNSIDSYMLSSDGKMAFAYLQSPYGSSETQHNRQLTSQLQEACNLTQTSVKNISVRLIGSPVIAVQNANQIKRDSIISISLALVLIIALLLFSFRKERRAIPAILLTTLFGWLFAMATLTIIKGQLSTIVLGIASSIIGIAVNYPLHVLFHNRYTSSPQQTLKEVISPLVIGNITTVAAFLTLVPLKATAMQDLGLFAAAMLVGTILFSITFLPQLLKKPKDTAIEKQPDYSHKSNKLEQLFSNRPLYKRLIVASVILIITAILFIPSRQLSFDTNLSNINYLTEQQRADFRYFEQLSASASANTTKVYIVDSQDSVQTHIPDSLLTYCTYRSASLFLPSEQEQEQRIVHWQQFWASRKDSIIAELQSKAEILGFSQLATKSFTQLLQTDFSPKDFSFFAPLTSTILQSYSLTESEQTVSYLEVPSQQASQITHQLAQANPNKLIFNIADINSSIAKQLSANFDYIGLLCSCIVFIFLCISFRSWRKAIIAFLPMAISWIWILGIMHLLGLQFNIVNIILATFIFGQGDDYTIFVVEALDYEKQTHQPMLQKFGYSTILSALIMLAGIGVLVISKHPAMFSLGAVTLIGMTVVVLLANIIPPLFYKSAILAEPNNEGTKSEITDSVATEQEAQSVKQNN